MSSSGQQSISAFASQQRTSPILGYLEKGSSNTGFCLTSGWGSLYLDYCSPSSMKLCKLHELMAAKKKWQPICMWFAYHLMPHSYENKMYTSFLPITAMNAHLSLRQADQDPQTTGCSPLGNTQTQLQSHNLWLKSTLAFSSFSISPGITSSLPAQS